MMERSFTLQDVREAERAAFKVGKRCPAEPGCIVCEKESRRLYPDAASVATEVALEAAGQLTAIQP